MPKDQHKRTFYLKLGDCLQPTLAPLNSESDFSISLKNAIKLRRGTGLIATEFASQIDARMSRIGQPAQGNVPSCRSLILHSHGTGDGRLVVPLENPGEGESNTVVAKPEALADFLISYRANDARLDQIFILACGIGHTYPNYDASFLHMFGSIYARAQNAPLTVYGPYYWVVYLYSTLRLSKAQIIESVDSIPASIWVENGGMAQKPNDPTNVLNWVENPAHFKKITFNENGDVTEESEMPDAFR